MDDAAVDEDRPMLLTFTAAGRKLGLSRWTVTRLVSDGHLDPVELPSGSRYIPAKELERFVEERTVRN